MKKIICLDRDGTIIVDKHYLAHADAVELLPNALAGLQKLHRAGYEFCVLTNQSGLGRGRFTLADYQAVTARILDLLQRGGVEIGGVFFCPHTPEENCPCRKPQLGLLQQAARALNFALSDAIVIGDKALDIELGKNAHARATFLVRTGYGNAEANHCQPDAIVDDLLAAATIIEQLPPLIPSDLLFALVH